MASFWRYANFGLPDPSGDHAPVGRGWAIPWSVDDLARRHWYLAVERSVTPLQLTAADWQRLRDLERPLWRVVAQQRRRHPQVDFWYEDFFAGQAGQRLRARVGDRELILYLQQQAELAGRYQPAVRAKFWQAVLTDLRSAKEEIEWRATGRYLNRRLTRQSRAKESADLSALPASWRRAVATASERSAEALAIKQLVRHWRRPSDWQLSDRVVIVSTKRLASWLTGWAQLAAELQRSAAPRQAKGEVELKEYYWHELTRGLSEAELLIEAIDDRSARQQLRRTLHQLRLTPAISVGSVNRDLKLLTGRWRTYRALWPSQAVASRWRELQQAALSDKQAAELARAWLKALPTGPDRRQWRVVVDDQADSWQVRPDSHQLVMPALPRQWSAAELLPILAHELTHVWQTEQGAAVKGLRIWQEPATSTQSLAEAGAMTVERAVRHYLGGPDQSREYYLAGLRARRRGGDFAAVMAAVARGLARQQGWSWSRVPVSAREELARQAFRRSLRLYRPTLRLTSSRRLLNEDQLKYVESPILNLELTNAHLEQLLYTNTVDLTRWPLCRRLDFPVAEVEPFPLSHLIAIIKETVMKLL